MFIEVIGRRPLPGDVDRDDVEDLLAEVLGADGEVTGAGTGSTGWHLDVELEPSTAPPQEMLRRLAVALVGQQLGWVILRLEHETAGRAAAEFS
ncbi:hypothetical protein [Winogradskya consettensis]|nr:hypothetical protein [Actinoplanes consettensis]